MNMMVSLATFAHSRQNVIERSHTANLNLHSLWLADDVYATHNRRGYLAGVIIGRAWCKPKG